MNKSKTVDTGTYPYLTTRLQSLGLSEPPTHNTVFPRTHHVCFVALGSRKSVQRQDLSDEP